VCEPEYQPFSHAQKRVTWYGEQIECCELVDDAQHCSEQFSLFEITRTALIVNPEHLELSISGMAVQESRVRSKL
jgi:hypothetical protein